MRTSSRLLSLIAGLAAGLVGVVSPQSAEAFSLVDDFDTYTTGPVAEATGGVWAPRGDAANSAIQELSGNQFLAYGTAGSQGAYRGLGDFSIDATSTEATYFLRFRANSLPVDHSFGLSDIAAPTAFGDFRVQIGIRSPTDDGLRLGVRDGNVFTDYVTTLEVNRWYNLWMVVNNASDTWDLYFSEDFEDGALITSGIGFRAAADALQTLLLIGNQGSLALSIDDVHYIDGADITNPIPEPAEIVFVQQPVDGNIPVGDSVTFSASTAGGPSARTFQWEISQDGGNNWSEIAGAETESYTVSNASLGDSGQYRLHVTSGELEAYSEVVTLTVMPDLTPEYAVASVGSSPVFSVDTGDVGDVDYAWRLDGGPVIGAGSSLTLSNVQESDAGVYTVTVTDNSFAPPVSVTLSAELTVYDEARAVFMTSGDTIGNSSFNTGLGWDDDQAPSAEKDYYTGDFLLRTPADNQSHTFGGAKLVLNSRNELPALGLMYKGWGDTGVLTIPNLVLDGGFIDHASGSGDHFRLAGNMHVTSLGGRITARQGPLTITAPISGTGPLLIRPGLVLTFAAENTYTGAIEVMNGASVVFADTSVHSFKVGADGENNRIFGQGTGGVTFNGAFDIDLTDASSTLGDSWQLIDVGSVNETFGENFSVTGFTKHGPVWVSGSYVFDEQTGILSVFDPTVPFFAEQPADIDAFVGDDVTITSLAYSDGTVAYQWYSSTDGENWTPITGADSASYTIDAAPYSAAGMYRVEATAGGDPIVSDVATLTLTFPEPTIVQGISDVTVREGDPFAFFLQAEGVGTLSFAWTKNEAAIGDNSNQLDLGTVDASDVGTYTVTITDDAAQVQAGLDPVSVTLTAQLDTFEAPPIGRAIGLNFVGAASDPNEWGGSPQIGLLQPEDSVGILPFTNWNNSADTNGVSVRSTPLPLAENSGASSGASATWSSNNTWAWSPDETPGQTGQERLFHGYIETRPSSSFGQSTVTIDEIPYPQYDVYVYVSAGEANSIGRVWLNDEEQEFFFKPIAGTFPRPYRQSTATSAAEAEAAEPATVVRFSGVTGSSFSVHHTDASGAHSGGIAGVAILDTTPAGTPYPPLVTTLPSNQFLPAGGAVEFSVEAVSQNEGGSLTYQWQKNGVPISGGSTLTFNDVTSADSGEYTVTITDSVSGAPTRTVTASLVVVDENRPALLSVDMQVGTSEPMSGHGILRPDGPVTVDPNEGEDNPDNIGEGDTVWNGLTAATGSATYANLVDAEGLGLTGLTFSLTGATGVEDAPTGGGIDQLEIENYSGPLLRDYAFTEGEDVISVTVGGLNAFAGKEVVLVVYALGKNSEPWDSPAVRNDVATVTLAEANNFDGLLPIATDQEEGRDLRFNNLGFATFAANVAGDGTVSWTIGSVEGEPGLNAFNGFQMLISNVGEHVTTTPLEDWRLAHFGTTEDSGTAANTADFDGDGFANILEYALGSDPGDPDSALEKVSVGSQNDFLTITFGYINDASLTYEIEAANDLSSGWTVVHTYPGFTEAGVETFTDSAAMDVTDHRFLRLKITAP